jgi:translation initiation factor IF-3
MPLRDEAITAPYVSLAEDDNLGDPQPLATVLASFDRSEFFLQQMTPVEEGREIPVVRIINKAAHRVAEKKRAKASKSKESTGKTLELGWAITAHDLKHRLDKMVAFLNEGRRVEVLIAQRKKARVLGYKEAAGLIKSVKDRAQAVEGTKERQAMTGVVGRSVTLFFEGKKP